MTLVGMQPNDAMAGNDGHCTKVTGGDSIVLAYLQNPDSKVPETANVSEYSASCRLHLPAGVWRIRRFDPRTGSWEKNPVGQKVSGGYTRDFRAPFPGDAVLLLNRS